MSIPFTQYLLPRGERRATEIDRSQEIEELAQKFINSGGRYESEVLRTGHVSLTAVKTWDGTEQDVAIVVCFNGKDVPDKVDELVKRSQKYLLEK